ncbi:MAG: alpha/beta hydrolase [bacterium]
MKLERISKQHPVDNAKGSILFLHGACMGAWVWEHNFFEYFFQEGYNVYAISLRNHCGSEHDGSLRWTSVLRYEEDLNQAIEQIPGKLFLVGHSMGGFTIQHHFKRISSRVAGAVLLCSAPKHGLWRLIPRLMINFPFHFIYSLFSMSWLPIMNDRKRLKVAMFNSDFPDDQLERIAPKLQDESFLAFLQMVFLKLPASKRAPVPTLIIGGGKDFLISEKDTRQMARSYGVVPVIIPNGSHCLMLEHGWQDVAEKINVFLSLQKNQP